MYEVRPFCSEPYLPDYSFGWRVHGEGGGVEEEEEEEEAGVGSEVNSTPPPSLTSPPRASKTRLRRDKRRVTMEKRSTQYATYWTQRFGLHGRFNPELFKATLSDKRWAIERRRD